jgi:hypothetical protein
MTEDSPLRPAHDPLLTVATVRIGAPSYIDFSAASVNASVHNLYLVIATWAVGFRYTWLP